MKTPIAWKNLAHQPARTAVSLGGISLAIVLMFLQLGFLGAVGDTATLVYGRMNGQLLIRSPEYLHAYDPRSIPLVARWAVESLPGIEEILPIDLGVTRWQNPRTHQRLAVAMIGIDPQRPAIHLPDERAAALRLRRPDHVLVDLETRADFGPANGSVFGDEDLGQRVEITDQSVKIAGTYRMGTGLAANGAILVNRDAFNRLSPQRLAAPADVPLASMMLVRLSSGAEVEQSRAQIRRRLADLGGVAAASEVLTLDEAIEFERNYWYWETPIGVIFAMGVAIAVLVGGVIGYLVLAADVLSHLPEYATLRAMGYGNGYLARVLLSQASCLAIVAFPVGVAGSLLLYAVTSSWAGVPIRMTIDRLLWVGGLSFAMCAAAGMVALRKLAKAEPANLF